MKRRNLHHMLWKASDYRGSYAQVRNLPCAKVMLDREVHRVLHRLYNYPKRISAEDAALLVHRHRNRLCACWEMEDAIEVDMLNIHDLEGGER